MTSRDKLIVALDLPSGAAASQMAERLQGHAGLFKVGSELFTAEGPVPVRFLITTGHKVFLDLKFHDIPNTVRAAAREAAELGVSLINVHASGGRKMMEAALEGVRSAVAVGRGGPGQPQGLPLQAGTKVLAVTILTSLEAQELAELGISGTPMEIVTPGIRPTFSATNDQARIATPATAMAAGADYLVVGRPVTGAPDPVAAADAIVAEMDTATIAPLLG